MEEDWVVLCQARYKSFKEEGWVEMHEKLREVSETIGVKRVGQRVPGFGKVAWRNTLERAFHFDKRRPGASLRQEARFA